MEEEIIERIETVDSIRKKTSSKQLDQIYSDQERRRKSQDRREKLLKKWRYIFGCCLI